MTETKAPSYKELTEEMGKLLKEAGGLESNLPLTSPYWDLRGQAKMAFEAERNKPAEHKTPAKA